ncbi:MAG: ABC transporter ATP-binding protein [Nocardioides sp.]|nr:ABC transporter ATP-binding protein [Nocardioides sp.]
MTTTEPNPATPESGLRPEKDASARPMIQLVELTKTFPGQKNPAVDSLSLDVARGEVVVLVGPSGCGKTTSMELINRLIEPTSGHIILDGEDVTTGNADELRRRIGYVIQETGLLPHRTIAQNIATVPQLVGWKRPQISDRVDELLTMVGMDPAVYRNRYPRELSGGQRQRVGVARAMAADPPVMLMDEPFGAIDPITRERLQNEFLRLQQQIQKTIIFVTHDINEAIKMGDKIAVLRDQSHVAQFDTPENILTNPANDYVADFIGAGASLRRLNLSRIHDVEMTTDLPIGSVDESTRELLSRLRASDWSALLVLDRDRRPLRWVTAGDLRRGSDVRALGLPAQAVIEAHVTLSDALNELITSSGGVAIVVDSVGAYRGVVDLETIMAAVRTMRDQHSAFYMAQKVQPDEVS